MGFLPRKYGFGKADMLPTSMLESTSPRRSRLDLWASGGDLRRSPLLTICAQCRQAFLICDFADVFCRFWPRFQKLFFPASAIAACRQIPASVGSRHSPDRGHRQLANRGLPATGGIRPERKRLRVTLAVLVREHRGALRPFGDHQPTFRVRKSDRHYAPGKNIVLRCVVAIAIFGSPRRGTLQR